MRPFRAKEDACKKIAAPLEEIRLLYNQGAAGNELLIKSDLLRIWHYLCQYPATFVPPSYGNDDAKIALIKDVLQYIRENYGSPLTLRMLSERFYMSEGQFCRFFKAQVNMTVTEYLNYYRVGAACDMLRDGTLPVSAIALDCGYSNISYFNRTFRKYMHCTPKEYRFAIKESK